MYAGGSKESRGNKQHCVSLTILLPYWISKWPPRQTTDKRHHDQTLCVQASFARDVYSILGVIKEMGNPFEESQEESQDLVIFDSKDIAGPSAMETAMNAKKIYQENFEAFTRECLFDRTKAVDDQVPRNKLNG